MVNVALTHIAFQPPALCAARGKGRWGGLIFCRQIVFSPLGKGKLGGGEFGMVSNQIGMRSNLDH